MQSSDPVLLNRLGPTPTPSMDHKEEQVLQNQIWQLVIATTEDENLKRGCNQRSLDGGMAFTVFQRPEAFSQPNGSWPRVFAGGAMWTKNILNDTLQFPAPLQSTNL